MKHVVENILNKVVEISDDEDKEVITLEENVVEEDRINQKTYLSNCNMCGHEIATNRKYVSLQLMNKHKETCAIKLCTECDFKPNDKQLQRHRRDEHGILSGSTSPPMKKKRKQSVEKSEHEEMDIQEDDDEDEVADLSLKLEEMDIDVSESDLQEERSKIMDNKIKEKEKLIMTGEIKAKEKRNQEELKKQQKKEKEVEKIKNEDRKKKQKIKDDKRRLKKKSNAKKNTHENRKRFKVPNI